MNKLKDNNTTKKAIEIGKSYYDKRKFERLPWYSKLVTKKQEKTISSLLKKINVNSILEIGCGYGRLTKILDSTLRPQSYNAIDLSEELITIAKKNISNVRFQCTSIQDFKTKEKFDLVFCGVMLMMINEKEIKTVLQKLISLSSKKIITIDPIEMFVKNSDYVFIHDYKKIFSELGVKKIQVHPVPIPILSKIVSHYAKLRGRVPIAKQAIFEIDV